MSKTILFISYWGIDEGLAQATVIPHVKILSGLKDVGQVILVTIERGEFRNHQLPTSIVHVPLRSKDFGFVIATKLFDFIYFSGKIKKLCEKYKVDTIFARSSLAGALAFLVWRKLKIPYTVESYEPHADYMIEAKVWRSWDPRAIIQRYFERKQNHTAALLLPVAHGFANELRKRNIPEERIIVMPCCVDTTAFAFSKSDRNEVRQQLQIPQDATVGIYAGKFGGIYYEEEAFEIFKQVWDFFGNTLHIIVLTNYDRIRLTNELTRRGIKESNIHIGFVPRDSVISFLSSSDFAFSFYRTSSSTRFLSPIKVGEYWANGLPVLLENGVGDDAEIILKEGGGVVFDKTKMSRAFEELKIILLNGREETNTSISQLAKKHRDLSIVIKLYKKILQHPQINSNNIVNREA